MKCFNCGREIEDTYYKCLDNYMQANYFEFEDERDNIFCSQECFCEFMDLTEIDNEEYDEDYEGYKADEYHELEVIGELESK